MERLMGAAVAGFLVGIFARSFAVFGWWSLFFFAALGGAIIIVALAARLPREPAIVAGVLCIAFALGGARMHAGILASEPLLDARLSEMVVIEGRVIDEPDRRENNVRIPVRVTSVGPTMIKGAGVLVIAPLHADVRYGDIVRAEGELRLPEAFDAGAGREFDYPAYLAKDGIRYELPFARVERIGDGSRNPLKAAAIAIKETYLDGIARALPEPEAGLAGGITAGDKRGLGTELSDTFRIVGLIHIVVLSGYNITVVIGAIERFLARAGRTARFSLAVMIAVFFALMTGLASSSVRAASMAVIATVGKATGRTYLAGRALALVAAGMLAWNPYLLAFDPGFQLSIIATVGLITVSPLFESRLGFLTGRFGLRETASATLGTQAAVLPLILYQSGSLSLYALPANLLTLVVVPYAMFLSFIAGVLALVTGPLAPLIGFPAFILLWYITSAARFFEWLPFSSIMLPAFPAVWLVLAYAAIAAYVASQKKTAESK